MELDKRIKAITDIKSVTDGCHDWELMNKKGYFANRIVNFTDLSTCAYGEYAEYREHDQCFLCEGDKTYYSYFLPEDILKPVEKKYRPYSLEEFLKIFDIGVLVEFRVKNSDELKCAMFTGYITDCERIDDKTPGAVELMLGNFHYSLFSLFEDFELFFEDKWQPFGIIDEDKE